MAILFVDSISIMACAIYISWLLNTTEIHFSTQMLHHTVFILKLFLVKVIVKSIMFKPNIQKSTNKLAYN